jgi:hypothetical protein
MSWVRNSELQRIRELLECERIVDDETRLAARLTIAEHSVKRPKLSHRWWWLPIVILLGLVTVLTLSIVQQVRDDNTNANDATLQTVANEFFGLAYVAAETGQNKQSQSLATAATANMLNTIHNEQRVAHNELPTQLGLTVSSLLIAVIGGWWVASWIETRRRGARTASIWQDVQSE